MELRLLRTFITIAEQGTVSNAATRLRITQPALSRQMQDLQRELGLRLFDRVGRRLVLTSAGEQLLSECRSLLGHADALGERVQLLRDGDTGVLKVATSPVQIEAVISTFLPRYIERFPKVQLKLVEAVGPDILAMLERGEINLGVVLLGVPEGDQRFSSHPVPPVEILAACHPSFPLRRGSQLNISELAPHPLLLLDPGYLVRKTFGATGYRLVEVHVGTGGGAPPPVGPMMRTMAADAEMMPPAVEGGTSEIQVSASGSIELK
jgi:DNA-binding transcriptional LysR family regulator